jgi:hypothetical protein
VTFLCQWIWLAWQQIWTELALTGKGRENLTCFVYWVYEINGILFYLSRCFLFWEASYKPSCVCLYGISFKTGLFQASGLLECDTLQLVHRCKHLRSLLPVSSRLWLPWKWTEQAIQKQPNLHTASYPQTLQFSPLLLSEPPVTQHYSNLEIILP